MQLRVMHGRSFFTLLILLFVVEVYCSAHNAFAQAGRAELTGEVRDQNGAAIAQSQVVVTEIATKQTRTAVVTETGLGWRPASDSTWHQNEFLAGC